ncbi:MAG: UDP-N-acetylmuramoyl-tripeptide--D-alanyl-D-alanine ligase [Erysipelotrichales bacterium]|nr:UDP-N-acetylmuramoyl-tripeptide--D-alanyl-D-alanine ligase [Erysipelotrichales bacterium]
MIHFTLKEVAEAVHAAETLNIDPEKRIDGVTSDSRNITAGNLFVPIKGERVNGHSFVVSCIQNGAAASLWAANEPHRPEGVPLIVVNDPVEALQDLAKAYRKTLSATIIGVTGSSGKTSTKDIIASVASVGYPTQKTQGNHNNEIGMPMTILGIHDDTKVAVVEMGIDGFGQMDLLGSIGLPDVAVITSISESHIDMFGSMEHITEQKYKITDYLREDGLFIYNADTPLLDDYAKAHPIKARTVSYGLEDKASFRALTKRFEPDGVYFTTTEFDGFEFHLGLMGDYEVRNALAAVLCGISLGLTAEEIQKGFDRVELTGRREDVEKVGNSTLIDGTYNSNPGSLGETLKMLGKYPLNCRKIAVLGDMYGLGERTADLHAKVGKECDFEGIDEIWTVGQFTPEIAKYAQKRYKTLKWTHFENKTKLRDALIKQCESENLIMAKASRAVELDIVVQEVRNAYER